MFGVLLNYAAVTTNDTDSEISGNQSNGQSSIGCTLIKALRIQFATDALTPLIVPYRIQNTRLLLFSNSNESEMSSGKAEYHPLNKINNNFQIEFRGSRVYGVKKILAPKHSCQTPTCKYFPFYFLSISRQHFVIQWKLRKPKWHSKKSVKQKC